MQNLYRRIPKVDLFMQRETIRNLTEIYGRGQVLWVVRQETEALRREADLLMECQKTEQSPEEGQVRVSEPSLEKRQGQVRMSEPSLEKRQGQTQMPGQLPEAGQLLLKSDTSGKTENFSQKELEAVWRKFSAEHLEARVREVLQQEDSRRFQHVINATGTVLHTNLGRAPLSHEQALRLAGQICGYSNLEYDLWKGKRGERYSHFEQLLCRITGAQAAVAVNNNAAAVLLILSALARGKEVIVSRGELIEIGGKFRIPEVIEQGGAILREVGTTNKTHPEDYQWAVGEQTGAVLKVHTSNYRIQGFTQAVSVRELAELKLGVPLIEDLGSGVLVNLENYGMRHEPTVQEAVAHGADLVCFSGDKLLGGPQAGIIVGKKEYIERIKVHPLMRAFRIDKFTAAALELVLREYLGQPETVEQRIPVLKMLSADRTELERKARELELLVKGVLAQYEEKTDEKGTLKEIWTEKQKEEVESTTTEKLHYEKHSVEADWELRTESCRSEAGGGSLPGEELEGMALTVRPRKKSSSLEKLQLRLRRQEPPVIGRISGDCLWLDVRTVFPEELPALAKSLAGALVKEEEESRWL